MNKKRVFLWIAVLVIVGLVVFFVINNVSITQTSDMDFNEYTPEEAISDEQLSQASITLYFLDKNSNELKSHAVMVNSKELLKNPYKTIVQKLLDGPDSENFVSVFPENTRLIDASLTENCVVLNFSDDLLKFSDDNQKFNIINSILNSLSQLTEVNSIRFLINNEPNDVLSEEYSMIS